MTEDELIQQKIFDHLAKIDTAMERMADAMRTAAIGGGINHQQIHEKPPYDVSTNADMDPERTRLQDSLHDRIDAIEKNIRTLQIVFAIAIIFIAICYYYSGATAVSLPVCLVMVLVIITGIVVSMRN